MEASIQTNHNYNLRNNKSQEQNSNMQSFFSFCFSNMESKSNKKNYVKNSKEIQQSARNSNSNSTNSETCTKCQKINFSFISVLSAIFNFLLLLWPIYVIFFVILLRNLV